MYKTNKKKSYFTEMLELKVTELRPNFINTNPNIMKRLCEKDVTFFMYAWDEAITEELIDVISKQGYKGELYLNQFLEDQYFKRSGITYSSLAMKKMCEINGHFFYFLKGPACTFENFEIAINHPNPERKIDIDKIEYYLSKGYKTFNPNFTPDYDLENFCSYNGKFLEYASIEIPITKEVLEKALSHDENKTPNITRMFEKNIEFTDEVCKLLVEKDAVYLMYIPEEKITPELIEIALSNKEKPLFFDRVPTDEQEGYIHNKNKSLRILEKLIDKDPKWYTYLDVSKLEETKVLELLNKDEYYPEIFLQNICNYFKDNKEIIKRVCLLNGNFVFTNYEDKEFTKELINLAINNPDKSRRLSFLFYKTDKKYDCEIMKDLLELNLDWLKYTDTTTLDEETFVKIITANKHNKYIPEPFLLVKYANNIKIIEAFEKVFKEDKYTPEDIGIMLDSAISPEFSNSILYSVLVEKQCKFYNVDYRFFTDTIRNILKVNEKIYTSLNYEFFQDIYHPLYNDNTSEKLLRLLNYPEIQKGIIKIVNHKDKYGKIDLELGRKKILLLSKILDNATSKCDDKYNDWVIYYNKVINEFNKRPDIYGYFAAVQEQLDDKLLEDLTCYVLGEHAYEIKSIEELKTIDEVRNNYIKKWNYSYDKKLRKEAIYESAFNISATTGEDLYNQLGRCVLEGKKEFDPRIVQFFKLLNKLEKAENPEIFYNLTHRQNKDMLLEPRDIVNLSELIKRTIINEYNKVLYNPKDESDRIDDIPIYKVAGEDGSKPFNLIIHSFAAYGSSTRYSEGYKFTDEWNRPDMDNHGICTSFIGNNLIATAEIKTVVYGFNNFEYSSLLLSNKNDMWSENTSFDISTEEGYKCEYFLPKEMTSHTKNGYNEMVFERLVDGKKRQPSYIVLLCDDYEKAKAKYLKYKRKGRYDTDEFFITQPKSDETLEADLFYNSIKAAQEFGVPIVVVEKAKIAKKEQQRILSRLKDFKLDIKLNREEINEYLYDTLISIESNSKAYGSKNEKYQELFDSNLANKVIKIINKKIESCIDSDPLISLMIIEEVEDLLESMNTSNNSAKTFDIYTLKKQMEKAKTKVLDSYNYPNHIGDLLTNKISNEENTLEYNLVMKDIITIEQIPISEANRLISKDNLNKMFLTISEIADDNLYDKNDINLNRHVENLVLFSTLIASQMDLNDEDLDILLTSALYQNYSNLEHLRDKYPNKDLSMIEAVLYLNEKNTNIEDLCNAVGIDKEDNDTINRVQTIAKILQDANTLEKSKEIIKEDSITLDMFNFDISKRFIKLAMQLNEHYAYQDIIKLTNEKPELYQVITDKLSIIKSPKKVLQEYKNEKNTSIQEESNYAK